MKASISLTFSAAHCIKGHPKCGSKHGHNYKIWLTVDGDVKNRMIMDFTDMKALLKPVIEKLDHTDLGDITSEELVVRIENKLNGNFPENVKRFRLTISESVSSEIKGDWVDCK